jgi:hypothetical protein
MQNRVWKVERMRVVPSCRDGQYLDTRSSKLTDEQIVRHIDMIEAEWRSGSCMSGWTNGDSWNVRRNADGV